MCFDNGGEGEKSSDDSLVSSSMTLGKMVVKFSKVEDITSTWLKEEDRILSWLYLRFCETRLEGS